MIDFNFIYENIDNIKFVLVSKDSNNEYIARKSYINEDLNDNLKQLYIKNLENIFKSKDLVKLDYEINQDDTIAYLEENELISSSNLLYNFIKDRIVPMNIENIDKLNLFAKDALFYSFVFQLKNQESIVIIRKMSSNYSLKNKTIVFFNDSRLNKINEDIVAFDNKIDIVIYKGKIYVLNKYSFEVLFSYRIYYKDRAQGVINILRSSNIIDNIDDFEEDCLERSRIVKKLAALSDSDTLGKFIDKFYSNPDIINNSIEKYELGIEIKDNKIKYNDISSLLQIVNFISDNYYQSDITEEKYTAKAKSKLIS